MFANYIPDLEQFVSRLYKETSRPMATYGMIPFYELLNDRDVF